MQCWSRRAFLGGLILAWTAGVLTSRRYLLQDTIAHAQQSFAVSGIVTDTNGTGVGNVQVFFFDLNSGVGFTGATTASDGSYSATVPASTYNVIFNPSCQQGLASTARNGITGPPDVVLNVTLLAGFSIVGTATAPGGGIFAFNTQTFVGFGLPPPDATGQYCISLEPGCYDLTFTPPPSQGLAPTFFPNVCGPPDLKLDVSYPPGFTVSGIVTDGNDGLGEAGVEIFAFDPQVGGFGVAPTVTDGAYAGSLPPGTYDLQFMPRPFSGLGSITRVDVTGPPDQALNITLPAGVTVFGTLTDPDGHPVSGVFVFAKPLWPPVQLGDDLGGWGAFSDVNGFYGKALRKGIYQLTFSPPPASGLCQAAVIVLARKDKQRNVQLRPCPQ